MSRLYAVSATTLIAGIKKGVNEMSNMSYCRFQNTSGDLEDCLAAIQSAYDGGYPISAEERAAGKRMFRRFLSFCRDADIIENYNNEALEELFDEAGGENDE